MSILQQKKPKNKTKQNKKNSKAKIYFHDQKEPKFL